MRVSAEDMAVLFSGVTAEGNVLVDEALSRRTTFRVGGAAKLFVTPDNVVELAALLEICDETGCPRYILGAGSNVLFGDAGFSGAVICLKNICGIEADGEVITSGAGAALAKVANVALDNELTGLEFASGIPGTIGGAVYMNAGAYGRETSDVFKSAVAVSKRGGGKGGYYTRELGVEDMAFGYRKSALEASGDVVVSVSVSLVKSSYMDIKAQMVELNSRRAEKQPLDMPSAGSAFKRPEGDYAGRLIDEAGLRGFAVGGAMVSVKHAGFIVNAGGATAADILDLVSHVKEAVYNRSGVLLEPEFKMVL